MNKFIYLLFLSIFLFDYLSSLGIFSRYITWFPELLSLLAILIIATRVTVGYGVRFPSTCSVFLILLLSNIIIGVVINHVSAGTLIAGIRIYLKFIPFFILPFIYSFSEKQINKQLTLLLFLFIIQAPISLYQRLVLSTGLLSLTGDLVKGTFSSSGHLTVALTCAIAILMSFFLKKRIGFKLFIVIFSLLFIPMTLNETKSAIIFLPIAFILPIYFSSEDIKVRQLVPLIALIILAGTTFVFIYDHFMRPRWGYGIIDFLFMEGRAEGYLYKGTDAGIPEKVGRIDSYILAFTTLHENILSLLFGLGIGNVSESFLPSLSGEYAKEYSSYNVKMTSFTLILWELGILGVTLYYIFLFISFKCSRRIGMYDNLIGYLSNGWSVVSLIIMISLLYSNVILGNIIGYLFWYFSGYIISESFGYNISSYKNVGK